MPVTSTPNHLPGSDASFPTPASYLAPKPRFPLIRSAAVTTFALFLSSLILSSFGVFAFLDPVSDFLAGASGIKDSVIRDIVDPITKKIPLALLPTGHNSGLDADTLDSLHGDAFARAEDLDNLANTVRGMQLTVSALEASSDEGASPGVTSLNSLSGNIKLVGGTGLTISQTGNTLTFQATSNSTSGVTSLTGGGGITVSAGTGAVTLGTSGIPYSALSLGGSIVGSDLASNIAISTSGNLSTTGSGTVNSAGLLTAASGLTISSGNLTVSGTAIFNNTGAAATKTNIDSSGNLLPGLNNSGTLGSAGLYWNNVFTNTLTANSISATTSGIAGTTSSTFTVNTDNATNDLEDMDLIFFRGTASPNGLLSWKQGLDRFEFNFPLFLNGSLSATGAVFSSAISAPNSTDTINGLVVNSGALSGITTLNLSGAITGATSSNTINGLVFSSGNATLANLTSSSGALTSTVADGASAIGFVLGTSTTYSTSGAKLLSLKNNTVEEFAIDKDGNLTVNGNLVATGTITGTQLISTVLTGTAPLVVSSTTQVANLNASFIEGYNAASLMSQPQPNLVLNSDFSRRNKWMTFMPEVFSDISGWTAIAGSLGSVASNLWTPTPSSGNFEARSGLSTWRDIRVSGIFQAKGSAVNDTLVVGIWSDANNWLRAQLDANLGRLYITENVGGTSTNLTNTSDSGALTVNNYYWIELERQGTKIIVKWYSCGATAVAKSNCTLQNTASATTNLAAAVSGYAYVRTFQAGTTHNIGGLSSGDGGFYVEGWGPESWEVSFRGTKGGQSIGIYDSDGQGPRKAWSLRTYTPASSRTITIQQDPSYHNVLPSTSYGVSGYLNTSGKGGSGTLCRFSFTWRDNNSSLVSTTNVDDAGETSWTRKISSKTTESSIYRVRTNLEINPSSTANGTCDLLSPQVEQGLVVTPWRNAPADDSPIVWRFRRTVNANLTTTGATPVAMDERDLAGNIFIPWDARLLFVSYAGYQASNGQYRGYTYAYVDGSNVLGSASMGSTNPSGGIWENAGGHAETTVSAGKHRAALFIATDGGASATWQSDLSGNYDDNAPMMLITATRGK